MVVKRKMTSKSLHIFSGKSYYRRLVFGGRSDSYKRRQMGRQLVGMDRCL